MEFDGIFDRKNRISNIINVKESYPPLKVVNIVSNFKLYGCIEPYELVKKKEIGNMVIQNDRALSLTVKIGKKYCKDITATINSRGGNFTGGISEEQTKIYFTELSIEMAKWGCSSFPTNYDVKNLTGVFYCDFNINLKSLSENYPTIVSYERELFPGAIIKFELGSIRPLNLNATIFECGTVNIVGCSSLKTLKTGFIKLYDIIFKFRYNIRGNVIEKNPEGMDIISGNRSIRSYKRKSLTKELANKTFSKWKLNNDPTMGISYKLNMYKNLYNLSKGKIKITDINDLSNIFIESSQNINNLKNNDNFLRQDVNSINKFLKNKN